jgi:class 3 adenylate cyclase
MTPPENMVNAQIAIVLTDIIGSTKFVQKHGARVAAKWFGVHDRMILSLITKFNGQWVDNSDGHLMYFAAVSDAIAFSFEYKKKLRQNKFPFRSRVGIHWDEDMIITKTATHLVKGGVKSLNIEGLGKARSARCMSICGAEQILLTKSAWLKFKSRTNRNPYIPKRAMGVLVGLYQFKGVSEPEQIYAMGLIEAQLQPPPDGDKVKRLGGAKKIKTRLRNKNIKEICWWIFWRIGFIAVCMWIYVLWPLLSDEHSKTLWNIDYWFLVPFEWVDYVFQHVEDFIVWWIEGFKENYLEK